MAMTFSTSWNNKPFTVHVNHFGFAIFNKRLDSVSVTDIDVSSIFYCKAFCMLIVSVFSGINCSKHNQICKFRGVIDWTKRHRISVLELRREARGETAGRSESPKSDGTFIQFMPSGRSASSNLRGISITFPDGVNLTLQESSVESVISLLTVYQSRRGGAEPCSD